MENQTLSQKLTKIEEDLKEILSNTIISNYRLEKLSELLAAETREIVGDSH